MSLYQPLDPSRHLMMAATADPETPPHYCSAYNIATWPSAYTRCTGYQPSPVIGQLVARPAARPAHAGVCPRRCRLATRVWVRPADALVVPGLGSIIPALLSHHAIGIRLGRPSSRPVYFAAPNRSAATHWETVWLLESPRRHLHPRDARNGTRNALTHAEPPASALGQIS
ncbi:MAG: hypothetical protein R3D67_21125 [Hyphomicrobiaceae bacterium]